MANMVDTFLLLTLARAGDSLQGIKKGVLELADVIAVNKADGAHVLDAKGAARELSAALHLVAPSEDGWSTSVLTCSAAEHRDLDAVWDQLRAHRRHLERTGQLAEQRRRQDVSWMWATIDDRLLARFRAARQARAAELEHQVRRRRDHPRRRRRAPPRRLTADRTAVRSGLGDDMRSVKSWRNERLRPVTRRGGGRRG